MTGALSRKTAPAWAILGAGLLAAVFAGIQVKQGIEEDALRQFAFSCDQVTLKIQERLGAYALILRGGAALFTGAKIVDRRQWRDYVATLRPEEIVPGVQGIGFAQVIAPDQLAAHIARVRGEGFPAYSVRPPGERAIYTSIIYLEPFRDRNLRAFGFDMFSEPIRRAAMEQARDSGEAALSGKVELVQETAKEVQAGTLMYVPVYRNGEATNTLEQRRAALIGWAYSPYRMNDLMGGILANWTRQEGKVIELRIYDGVQEAPASMLYYSKADTAAELNPLFHQHRKIDFNGRQWLLVFDHAASATGISYAHAWAALIGGIALSGVLFGLMLSVINTRTNAARIADELTEAIRGREKLLTESEARFRAMADSAPVLIWILDEDRLCNYVNKVWLDFTGRRLDQEMGSGWTAGVYPDDVQRCRDSYVGAFDARREFVLEYRLRRFDGEYRWLVAKGVPRHDDQGSFMGFIGSCIDITERKQAELAASKANRLLEESISSIAQGFTIYDENDRLIICNEAYRSLYNTSRDLIVQGATFEEIVRKGAERGQYTDAVGRIDEWVKERVRTHQAANGAQHEQLLGDGRWLLIVESRTASGFIVGNRIDITARKLAEAELDRHRNHLEALVEERTAALNIAKEAAEAANRAKTIFLANMSHERRTPLNGIMGMTGLAMRRATDPKQKDQLAKVEQSTQRLVGIINDILDIAKIEAERLTLELAPFHLAAVLENLTILNAGNAREKGLTLSIDIDPDLAAMQLLGDPLRLGQILTNLASNAIKFTAEGSVSVRVLVAEENPRDVLLRFDVRDTGIGIPAEIQKRVFDPFEQADGSITRKYGGTGLGLAISKRLAEAMGGQIRVESQVGAGSTFSFSLRLKKSTETVARQAATQVDVELLLRQRCQGSRILVADDEPINREITKMLLEDIGILVDTAEDGAEALLMAGKTDYAAIFLDMQMPNVNGLDAARQIRLMPGYGKTPIIAMTANAYAEDKAKCLAAGMNEFLVKPFNPDELFASLHRTLDQASA